MDAIHKKSLKLASARIKGDKRKEISASMLTVKEKLKKYRKGESSADFMFDKVKVSEGRSAISDLKPHRKVKIGPTFMGKRIKRKGVVSRDHWNLVRVYDEHLKSQNMSIGIHSLVGVFRALFADVLNPNRGWVKPRPMPVITFRDFDRRFHSLYLPYSTRFFTGAHGFKSAITDSAWQKLRARDGFLYPIPTRHTFERVYGAEYSQVLYDSVLINPRSSGITRLVYRVRLYPLLMNFKDKSLVRVGGRGGREMPDGRVLNARQRRALKRKESGVQTKRQYFTQRQNGVETALFFWLPEHNAPMLKVCRSTLVLYNVVSTFVCFKCGHKKSVGGTYECTGMVCATCGTTHSLRTTAFKNLHHVRQVLNGNNGEWTNSDDVVKKASKEQELSADGSDICILCQKRSCVHEGNHYHRKRTETKETPLTGAARRIAERKRLHISSCYACNAKLCKLDMLHGKSEHYHLLSEMSDAVCTTCESTPSEQKGANEWIMTDTIREPWTKTPAFCPKDEPTFLKFFQNKGCGVYNPVGDGACGWRLVSQVFDDTEDNWKKYLEEQMKYLDSCILSIKDDTAYAVDVKERRESYKTTMWATADCLREVIERRGRRVVVLDFDGYAKNPTCYPFATASCTYVKDSVYVARFHNHWYWVLPVSEIITKAEKSSEFVNATTVEGVKPCVGERKLDSVLATGEFDAFIMDEDEECDDTIEISPARAENYRLHFTDDVQECDQPALEGTHTIEQSPIIIENCEPECIAVEPTEPVAPTLDVGHPRARELITGDLDRGITELSRYYVGAKERLAPKMKALCDSVKSNMIAGAAAVTLAHGIVDNTPYNLAVPKSSPINNSEVSPTLREMFDDAIISGSNTLINVMSSGNYDWDALFQKWTHEFVTDNLSEGMKELGLYYIEAEKVLAHVNTKARAYCKEFGIHTTRQIKDLAELSKLVGTSLSERTVFIATSLAREFERQWGKLVTYHTKDFTIVHFPVAHTKSLGYDSVQTTTLHLNNNLTLDKPGEYWKDLFYSIVYNEKIETTDGGIDAMPSKIVCKAEKLRTPNMIGRFFGVGIKKSSHKLEVMPRSGVYQISTQALIFPKLVQRLVTDKLGSALLKIDDLHSITGHISATRALLSVVKLIDDEAIPGRMQYTNLDALSITTCSIMAAINTITLTQATLRSSVALGTIAPVASKAGVKACKTASTEPAKVVPRREVRAGGKEVMDATFRIPRIVYGPVCFAPMILAPVEVDVQNAYVCNGRFKLGKAFKNGELNFTPLDVREIGDPDCRTLFGPVFVHSCIIHKNTPHSLRQALRRLTGVREADIPGLDQRLRQNQRDALRCYSDVLHAAFSGVHVDHEFDEVEDAVKVVLIPHKKRLLREQVLALIKLLGQLGCSDWHREDNGKEERWVIHKLKRAELAKFGKYGRIIVDLGVGRSLAGAIWCDKAKEAVAAEIWRFNNCAFMFAKSNDPSVIDAIFNYAYTCPDEMLYVVFSDDAFLIVNKDGKRSIYNLDIKGCDLSHTEELIIFILRLFGVPPELIDYYIRQILLPIKIMNPDTQRGGVNECAWMTPLDLYLQSGSTITTLLNTIANLIIFIVMVILGYDYHDPENIIAAWFHIGYLADITKCEIFEDIQFLKHSPVLDIDGIWRAVINVGPMFRALGNCKGVLTTSARTFRVAADGFHNGVLKGFTARYKCPFYDKLRRHESGGKVYVSSLNSGYREVAEKYTSRDEQIEFTTESLFRRYVRDDMHLVHELEEFLLAVDKHGSYIVSDLVDAVLLKDYGYEPTLGDDEMPFLNVEDYVKSIEHSVA